MKNEFELLLSEDFHVSRETVQRLELFQNLLEKWQKSINLVSNRSIPDIWNRHIMDSVQLVSYIPDNVQTVLDIGSGGGFPGLVLAILAKEHAPKRTIHLVESDKKKAGFLREAARICECNIRLHNKRIESVEPFKADVVTARALAPLVDLLAFASPFSTKYGICLFLKGQNVDFELTEARKKWTMQVTKYQSITDETGVILKIDNISGIPAHDTQSY